VCFFGFGLQGVLFVWILNPIFACDHMKNHEFVVAIFQFACHFSFFDALF